MELNGDYNDFLRFMESIIASIIPNHVDSYTVTGDETQKRLRITVEFTDDEPIGLLCGYARQHLKALLTLARAQQIYSHDRFILLEIVKSDGSCQSFINKNCATIRKQDARKTRDDGSPKYDNGQVVRRALGRSFQTLKNPFPS